MICSKIVIETFKKRSLDFSFVNLIILLATYDQVALKTLVLVRITNSSNDQYDHYLDGGLI